MTTLANETGAITGKFGTIEAPEIESIQIYEKDTEIVPTTLTPQQEYDIKVTVSDADTLDQLEKIQVRLWYDESGVGSTSYYFTQAMLVAVPAYGGNGDFRNLLSIEWNRAPNNAAIDVSLQNFGSSWSLTESVLPTDFTANTFEFIFTVKVGKVARETIGDAKWQLSATVKDQGNLQAYLAYEPNMGIFGIGMNWYGEITVPPDYEIVWEDAAASMDFNHSRAVEQVFFAGNSLNIISNGDYIEQVKSVGIWDGSDDTTATLVTGEQGNPLSGSREFALKIDVLNDSFVGNPPSISTDFTNTRQSGIQTWDVGDDIDDYYMFLKLSNGFEEKITYSGSLTFGVVNASIPD